MGRNLTFKGGIHPLPKLHHGKLQTERLAIEVMPAPETVSIPCAQHIGAPAVPIVEVGDKVKLGQKIAEASGFVSVPVHASVSGTVKEIAPKPNKAGRDVVNIVIANDFEDTIDPGIAPKGSLDTLTPDEIRELIKEAGNIGLGGAGFPTHAKLSPPADKPINTVIVNGAECEPFLTADHRVMLENPGGVILGLKAVMKALDVKLGFIAVEDNKMDAAAALQKALDTNTIRVKILETKYPQGSEKQLIDSILGRQVPSGGLPMDVGVVVINAASAAAIAEAIDTGMPIVNRVVTVTGHVENPKNLLVRIGTPIKEVLDYCGGMKPGVKRLIDGGPMMGTPLDRVDGVVTKTTSGLLALGEDHIQNTKKSNCIHCGRCASVCPMHLMPMMISAASDHYDWERAEKYHAMDCMGCGCCSFICPANRHLCQSIRVAKDAIAAKRRKKQ